MHNEAHAGRMQVCNASVAWQWHGEITPTCTLEYVRSSHQPYAISIEHQSSGSERLKPALIQARQRNRALQQRIADRIGTPPRYRCADSNRSCFYCLPMHAITLARRLRLELARKTVLTKFRRADESFVVLRFANPRGIDFPYLLSMLHDSFMSRANTLVVPGGEMERNAAHLHANDHAIDGTPEKNRNSMKQARRDLEVGIRLAAGRVLQ